MCVCYFSYTSASLKCLIEASRSDKQHASIFEASMCALQYLMTPWIWGLERNCIVHVLVHFKRDMIKSLFITSFLFISHCFPISLCVIHLCLHFHASFPTLHCHYYLLFKLYISWQTNKKIKNKRIYYYYYYRY